MDGRIVLRSKLPFRLANLQRYSAKILVVKKFDVQSTFIIFLNELPNFLPLFLKSFWKFPVRVFLILFFKLKNVVFKYNHPLSHNYSLL